MAGRRLRLSHRATIIAQAVVRLLFLMAMFVITSHTQAAEELSAHWIWAPESSKGSSWQFSREFQLPEAVQAARLQFAADFCDAQVVINGQQVLSIEPYCQTQELDVTTWMRRGENSLKITAYAIQVPPTYAVESPPAVALSLSTLSKDQTIATLTTDGRWQCAINLRERAMEPTSAAELGRVRPELWGIGRRPATVSPLENYEQWRQATAATKQRQPKLWTAPGFEITTLRVAEPNDGSWISLAFDRQGRATISREDKGLLRMTLDEKRSKVERVETIDTAADLAECRGLLYDGDWLYANANNSKGMYRLPIDQRGELGKPELLREFPGNVGHGRNDLALGPDGRIYSIHGDAVTAPESPIVDRTSPLRESRASKPRKEGYLVRADRDGTNWELICTGLRNPYGIAFHPNGDLFTYDADNEHDMGTPWYRPTRLVQLLSGADYGYREANSQWPPNFPDHPDNGLPVIDIGRGSPTSVMFGTDLKFPTPYREALYILDWAYGRVVAIHLAPRGGGYRAATELFLQGQPLNVTDIAAGPDGAMYLTTGGRKTQSALYRVAFTGQTLSTDHATSDSQHEHDAAEFSNKQRALRKKLEAFHGVVDLRAIDEAWPHLISRDPTIAHAARIAIEQQPVESWKSKAVGKFPPHVTPWHAWMAEVRTGDVAIATEVIEQLARIVTQSWDLSEHWTIPFLYQQCHVIAPQEFQQRREAFEQQLMMILEIYSKFPTPSVSPMGTDKQLCRRLAILLGEMSSAKSVELIANSLLTSSVQEDKLAALLALRNQREGWTPATRRLYFEALNDGALFVRGEGMTSFLDRMRTEALATLTDAEKVDLADFIKPPAVADEPLPDPRPLVKAWTLDDLKSTVAIDASAGDAQRGEKIFRDALCSRCHRSGARGPAIGPDLTFVARRFSRRDMLESIISPSLAVAEQYRNIQVVTESGQIHVGRMLSEGDFRSETLRLNTDPLRPGHVTEIDKKEISESHVLGTSPMPQGLLNSLTAEEINDLLAYLESGAAR